MATEKGQKKGKDKWKEKSWYTLVAPNYLGGKELTLTPANGEKDMIGRNIEVPVSDFTGNFKRSSAKITFRVVSCQGTKCDTMFLGHSISDDYIRRMVRRRKERIDMITNIQSTDGFRLAVKIVVVTDGKLTSSKRATIRKVTEDFLHEKTNTMNFQDLSRYIIGEDIANEIVEAAKDVYPIKKIEIRKSEVLGIGTEVESHPEPAPEAPPETVS
ncbi:MAG: 30S ribosomal protein S3ae [Thermoplasmatales archaeon B_DKE]|nr:MAG: 30S ribosomal protein S3ae [Thermoplasmatales archaeon B_DKE]QRF76120.1 30S ribosomal protein S3Ae [Thermoplasmatales archaeon]